MAKTGRVHLKEWKNGRYQPKWTARIVWFQTAHNDPTDIRLQLEDCQCKMNYYPQTQEEADAVWFMFKQGAPVEGHATPFVQDLLALVKRNYPHTTVEKEPNNG
jgi:hypothetical protein